MRIRTLPGFPAFSIVPDGFAREAIDSDPVERRILLANVPEMIQRLSRKFRRYEQFARPVLKRLSAKLDFD